MQARTMDITRQLAADRHAELLATARRGRLRRLLSRADAPAISVDIAALERADDPTPSVLVAPRPVADVDTGCAHKVA